MGSGGGWNLLGILDLVVAVGSGALSCSLAGSIAGEVTTASMAQMPLVLIPAYLGPLFVMLHLAALFLTRRLVASGHSSMRVPGGIWSRSGRSAACC